MKNQVVKKSNLKINLLGETTQKMWQKICTISSQEKYAENQRKIVLNLNDKLKEAN